ncbi:uncharacterized protein Z519_12715 [Cladophialophora bantiana CBS 173.52]|uniref:J domain-containing protein n=1 Tax=Cladophialophora bantiana (strain ATCC 10958 / CBS 173.52 / CDC B-1940 / NIH 8579) TaxID=1442370 RepID=A0A0D2H707_CLAB1|nr:uncharacterized protein Z519_12715 [Cladophialophora bantiana CBS 173.52]KIW86660.1 hypothetical protein Z519_12715 [Cladophialophora bantiana CBS 173.52]
MATHIDNPQGPVTNPEGAVANPQEPNKHSRGNDTAYGMLTPESTPAPEDGRIAADQARRAREARQQDVMPPIAEEPSQSKPPYDASQADQESENVGGDSNSDKAEAVRYVLGCQRNDYRKILKLEPAADDPQEKANIMNAFTRLGCLTHPDYNETEGAHDAFMRVLKAGKKLGVERDEINQVKFWDGEEVFEEIYITSNGNYAAKVDQMEIDPPTLNISLTETHKQIWGEATSLLSQLMDNPNDGEVIAKLNNINTKIMQVNMANGFPVQYLNNYTINIDTFKHIFIRAAPLVDQLKKNHADKEAWAKWNALNDELANFRKLCGFPDEWVLRPPPENVSGPVVGENVRPNEAPAAYIPSPPVEGNVRPNEAPAAYVPSPPVEGNVRPNEAPAAYIPSPPVEGNVRPNEAPAAENTPRPPIEGNVRPNEAPAAENTPRPPIEGNVRGDEPPSTSTMPVDQLSYRRCTRREGYVRDGGIDKRIEGHLKVGIGYQLVISHPGKNNLTIYEKVAASTFGKHFGKEYSSRPDAKTITRGTAKELENVRFEQMAIAGVASDRRDPKKEPAGGWAQQARTLVLAGFGDNPKFVWYPRSTLGQRFGQALVDEEITAFRIEAGQEEPLQPTRRVSRPLKVPTVQPQTAPEPPQSDESLMQSVKALLATMIAKLDQLEGEI